MTVLSLGFELICYRFVFKDWQLEIRHSHYYTFNISSTVSAIITTPMPYQFHITNSFTTDDTPQSNQFNFLISSNVSLLQYIIHMFLLPFHFFSTASTIQSSIHPISSILSLHQCSLSSFHPLLTLSPPLSLLPYQQLLLYLLLPIICIPHHFSIFLPSLHSIFLYPPSYLPFCNHSISFNHIHHPLLYAPLLYHAYVSHFLYCPPHSTTTTLGSRPRCSFIVLLPR